MSSLSEESDKFIQMEMEDLAKKENINDDSAQYAKINFSENKSNTNEENIILDTNYNHNICYQFFKVIKYFFKKINNYKKIEKASFILSISAIIFYIIGLQGCYGDEVYCLANLGLFFYLKIIIINVISSLCVCAVLVLITFRKISFVHLLYLFPSFLLLINLDQGTTLAHHGYYNCLGHIVLLIIFYPISSFVYLMIRLIRNKRYKIYIPILITLFIFFIWFYVYIKINTKCDNWDIGLNNTRIYNNEDEYACQINLPKSCYINIFDGKFNVTKIMNVECSKRDDKEKRMLFEYIKIIKLIIFLKCHLFQMNQKNLFRWKWKI